MAAETHNGNLNRSKAVAQPSAGARRPAGKTNNCDEALREGKQPVAEAVTQCECKEGEGIKAAARQNGGNVIPVTLAHEDMIANARGKNGAGNPSEADKDTL